MVLKIRIKKIMLMEIEREIGTVEKKFAVISHK